MTVQTEIVNKQIEGNLKISPESGEVKWLKVLGVSEPYDRVALLDDDIFFQLEVFGLTRANLVSWFVETETGTVFVTANGKIFVASNTIISMLERGNHPDLERFKQLVSKIYRQAIDLYYPEESNGKEKRRDATTD